MSALIRRFTKIGSRNKFILFGLGLTIAVYSSPRLQQRIATGSPVLRDAGSAINSLLDNLLPFKIIGSHLSTFGAHFKRFTGDFADSINNIFAPIKDFLEWGKSYLPDSSDEQGD